MGDTVVVKPSNYCEFVCSGRSGCKTAAARRRRNSIKQSEGKSFAVCAWCVGEQAEQNVSERDDAEWFALVVDHEDTAHTRSRHVHARQNLCNRVRRSHQQPSQVHHAIHLLQIQNTHNTTKHEGQSVKSKHEAQKNNIAGPHNDVFLHIDNDVLSNFDH